MLTILYARAGQETRRELLERMGRSAAPRRLLLVPEQYSHESERALCQVLGCQDSQGCEVLSFTRLAARLTDVAGGAAAPMLDGGGRMLLLYAALRQVGDLLKVYRTPSRKPAFLTGLLATLDECRSYRVTPNRLMEAGERVGGQQGDKWRDIGLIYQAYEGLAAHAAADPRSRLDRLAHQLEETEWGTDAAVFVHGFTDFTPQEEEVLAILARQGALTVALVGQREEDGSGVFVPAQRCARRLIRRARGEGVAVVEQTLCRPRRDTHPGLAHLERHLFGPLPQPWTEECPVVRIQAADRRQELEWAAAEILRLTREEGVRFRDIALCARQLDGYGELADSVLEQYGIPVFRSVMEDILEKPVLALVTAALSAVAQNYPYEELFRYLKTDLTGITRAQRDALENYALTWNLRGSIWSREKPWDMHPEGYGRHMDEDTAAQVAQLDALRRQVIAPLERLRKAEDHTGRGRALALYDFLEEIGLPQRLEQRAEALEHRGDLNTAAQYRQLWDILVGGLEQCALLLEQVELDGQEFARLFALVLGAYDVGAIPVSLDRVTVSESPRIAHREVKVLFLLGADSVTIPNCAPAPGLFSDQDRQALAEEAVELAPRQEDKLRRELTIAYETCAIPTRRLYISYARTGAGGQERMPCMLWNRVGELFPQSTPRRAVGEMCRLAHPVPALERVGGWPALAAVLEQHPLVGQRVERLRQAGQWKRGRLSAASVRALFGQTVPMSATRLDLYNSCHFSHFLRYGLSARPRQRAMFRPSDYGSFVHSVLEAVLRSAEEEGGVAMLAREPELRRSLVHAAADAYEREVLSGLEEEARFRCLFRRMKGAVLDVVDNVLTELSRSDFAPVRFELRFGRGGELPALEATGQGTRLELSGFVDRVDLWEHEGKRYLRVIDYKTGKKDFDFTDLESGRGLQMLLYLFALSRVKGLFGGDQPPLPAGVLYVPARRAVIDGPRGMSPQAVEKERCKQLRRQGLVLDDSQVLAAMEHGEGGTIFLPDKADFRVTPEQLEQLERYVERVLCQVAGQISLGNIDADPFWRSGEDNACRYCDYKAACHFEDCWGDKRRWRRGIKSAEFWSKLSREEEEHHGLSFD